MGGKSFPRAVLTARAEVLHRERPHDSKRATLRIEGRNTSALEVRRNELAAGPASIGVDTDIKDYTNLSGPSQVEQ